MPSPALTMANNTPNTVIAGSTGWTPKVGKLVSSPDKVAVFYDTGGQNPNPRWLVDYVMVQCIVRALPNDYGAGWTKIREIRDYWLGFESADLAGERWVSVSCQGDIGFINYDDKERPTFSVNFRIIIEPATNALTPREPL